MLEKLTEIAQTILDQQNRIKDMEEKTGLKAEKEILGIYQNTYEKELDALLGMPLVDTFFEPDKFTDGKYSVIKENGWELLKKPFTKRVVRSEDFINAEPLIAAQIAKIEVGKAEDKIGKEALAKYCDEITTTSHELIKTSDRKEPKKKTKPKPPKITDSTMEQFVEVKT
jgi:hypothetical protein